MEKYFGPELPLTQTILKETSNFAINEIVPPQNTLRN